MSRMRGRDVGRHLRIETPIVVCVSSPGLHELRFAPRGFGDRKGGVFVSSFIAEPRLSGASRC